MLIARKMNCQSHAVNWWREKASLQNGKFQTVKIYHQNSTKQRNRWLRIVWQSMEQDWRNLWSPNEDLCNKFLMKFRCRQFICTHTYTIRELSPFAWFMSCLYHFIEFFLMWPLERAKPANLFLNTRNNLRFTFIQRSHHTVTHKWWITPSQLVVVAFSKNLWQLNYR